MSSGQPGAEVCDSLLDERDLHGGFAMCDRDKGHGGMHVGHAPDSERFQWRDEDAWRYVKLGDELADEPMWYRVLPIGEDVDVDLRQHPSTNSYVTTLHGVVLDDHEQPAAIILGGASGDTEKRVLIPWANVASIIWDAS